jgi:hypothetical protein
MVITKEFRELAAIIKEVLKKWIERYFGRR